MKPKTKQRITALPKKMYLRKETRLERRARRLKAANELLGIWANKDTSFFDEMEVRFEIKN